MSDLIQGLWIGRELSLMEQLSIKSFIANGHCYHLYTYEEVKNVPPGTIVLDANTIVAREQIFALKRGHDQGSLTAFSNLFRFELLFEKGGWWVDLDLVCLKRFDFSTDYVITSECDDPDGYCGPSSAVLKVPMGDEFIGACLSKTLYLCSNPETLDFGDTGYKLVREMVQRYNLDSFVQPPETFAPVHWWQYKKFIEPQDSFPDLSKSYAVHFYNEMWRREMQNKNDMYSDKSLYGFLLRKYL